MVVGITVPTGYDAPSGACVIDVWPGWTLMALLKGTAISFNGPTHSANSTPLTVLKILHGIQNILLIWVLGVSPITNERFTVGKVSQVGAWGTSS